MFQRNVMLLQMENFEAIHSRNLSSYSFNSSQLLHHMSHCDFGVKTSYMCSTSVICC